MEECLKQFAIDHPTVHLFMFDHTVVGGRHGRRTKRRVSDADYVYEWVSWILPLVTKEG